MGKKGIVVILAALLAGSLACDSLPFLTPQPTATPTSTPTLALTPTRTMTSTLTPYPTRTASPTLIPGVEEPVEVEDATLMIGNVIRRDAFRCREDSEPVGNPEAEEFLILLMKVVKGPKLTSYQVDNWIGKNGIDRMGIRSSAENFIEPHGWCYVINIDTMVLTEIDLAYVIDRNAKEFFLILPDGKEIPLESFLP
jgi:hypothetical protein